MLKKALFLSAAVAAGTVAVQSRAATLTMSDNVDAAYTDTTTFGTATYNASLNPATTGIVYEIPIYFEISGGDFGGVDVTATTSGGVTIDSVYSYYPSDDVYPSGKGSAPYYATNSEAGTLNANAAEIVAAISSGVTNQSDPRISMGKSGDFWLGDIYVDVNGDGYVNLTVNNFATNTSGVLVNVYGQGSDNSGSIVNADAIHFVVPTVSVPTPAAIWGGFSLLSGLAVLRSRKLAKQA